MRIGHWKSGDIGVEMTNEEVGNLGGTGETIGIKLAKPSNFQKFDKPQFDVYVDPTSHVKMLELKKLSKRRPDITHLARFRKGMATIEKPIIDFALLEAIEVKWIPSFQKYKVTLDWSKRKPAHSGRIGSKNGSQSEPLLAYGNIAGTVSYKAENIGSRPATASNILAPRVATVLERLNYIIQRNPGRIRVFIKKDGTIGAEVLTAEVI